MKFDRIERRNHSNENKIQMISFVKHLD